MKDGIYHVHFSANGDRGEGLVVIKDNAVNGGDTGYLFKGSLTGPDDQLRADLHVQQWNPAVVSVFGKVAVFDLNLAGSANDAGGTFTVTGSVVGHPAMRIRIDGRYLAAAA